MKILLGLAVLIAVACGASAKDGGDGKFLVCYWGTWSHYRPGNGQYRIENIDPTLCTHYIYAFAVLNDGQIASHDPWLDLEENHGLGMFSKFTALKQRNPLLKVLIAIGGWNEGSKKYSEMASTAVGRRRFIDSVLRFVQRYGFDGLDLDWEYPGVRGGKPEDKKNHALLLQELREEFDNFGYLLTAAVAAGKETIDAAYDIGAVSKYLHFMNVMCYDYFGAWANTTGHNSPIKPRPEATDLELVFNIEYSLKYWISHGADPKKIMLGLPMYGRTFTLESSHANHVGAPVLGPGNAGPYTREPGYLGYNEICEQMNQGKWNLQPKNDYIGAPIATHGNEWIGFDDAESLQKKVQFGKEFKLGGVMVWSVETDDFQGRCHARRYHLLNAIKNELNSGSVITTTSSSDVTTRPTTTTTGGPFTCTETGYFPHPTDNTKFYKCAQGADGKFNAVQFSCPAGTVFSPSAKTCVHKYQLHQ